MDADAVRQRALQQWNDRAPDDRHHQQPGAVAGQRPQSCDPRVKMVGNIRELNKPTRRMAHIAR